MPQLTDQKWTSTGCPAESCRTSSGEPANHSVAPSSEGMGVPIRMGIIFFLRAPG
jgi:hypothetical protein